MWGPGGTRVVAAESYWRQPVAWDAAAARDGVRRRVFCASLADVFEDWAGPMTRSDGTPATTQVPGFSERPMTVQDVRVRLLKLICDTPNLDWLLLTKRPRNVTPMLRDAWHQMDSAGDPDPRNARPFALPRSVWLGTSVEDQQRADERVPELLKVPAAVRFLSCEPLLGPVDLSRVPWPGEPSASGETPTHQDVLGRVGYTSHGYGWPLKVGIDWVIVGGESGADARPCALEWVRSLVVQCRAAGVACFVKQMGAAPVMDEAAWQVGPVVPPLAARNHGRAPAGTVPLLMTAKAGDPAEWPEELRVREFPNEGCYRERACALCGRWSPPRQPCPTCDEIGGEGG